MMEKKKKGAGEGEVTTPDANPHPPWIRSHLPFPLVREELKMLLTSSPSLHRLSSSACFTQGDLE